MQQFVVPQFIDVESKILGPFSIRQFILLIIWGGLEFAFFKLFEIIPFVGISFLLFTVFLPVTFLKYNGKPFHYFVFAAAANAQKPKIRVWSNLYQPPKISETKSKRELREEKKTASVVQFAQKTTNVSKLSELSLVVDTGGIYEGERSDKDIEKARESLRKTPK